MNIILIKALQLLCCLSLLVVLHEGGHFMFSKLFKVRVEKFYMFFNPKFHLFSTRDKWFTRLFPYFKDNETEYGIGWIPLGGYVKIAGMIDESMDKEQMKQPAQPDEFRSQSVIKRFFIMVGGVLMNLITALVIYSAIMFTWGRDLIPMERIPGGFVYNTAAHEAGFRNGDIPVAINGQEVKYFKADIIRPLSEAKTVTVLRDGHQVVLDMPESLPDMLEMSEMNPPFLTPFVACEVDSVLPGTPAMEVGLEKGSRILAIDQVDITCWAQFDSIMQRKNDVLASGCSREDSLALRKMDIAFLKGADTISATMQLNEKYMLGITRSNLLNYMKPEHLEYSLFSSIPAGIKYGWDKTVSYVHDLKYVFTPKGAKSVGSFITIGSIFPDTWDWAAFWNLTALISIMLAVMNILPIPGLDGGHIFFLLIEAITRRPPSEKVMTIAEYIGMGILILLMIWAFGNDLMRFVF